LSFNLPAALGKVLTATSMTPAHPSGGLPAAGPDAVLSELTRQADRRASLKMFYSAADLFRDYRGPYAAETARERERLAAEFEERGRAAEKQRWEGGPPVPAPKPVAPVKPPAPPREVRPLKPAPPPPPAKPVPAGKGAPPPKIEDGKIILSCRWCHESISYDVASAGKLLPCPKCDMLVSVPKLNP
jgi:hypothetical protein